VSLDLSQRNGSGSSLTWKGYETPGTLTVS
ncbi:hypothetical protein A2U01_0087514, partial [Trifolium medium]|nr:hypothetical protein [Trifolium medium]